MANDLTYQQIKQLIEEIALKAVSEEEGKEFNKLIEAANNFISFLEQKSILIQNENNFIKSAVEIKNFTNFIYGRMASESQVVKDISVKVNQFETALNTFLHRKINLSWMDLAGNFTILSELGAKQVYEKVTTNYGRGNVSAESMNIILQNNKNIDKWNRKINNQIANKIDIYNEAILRYNDGSAKPGTKKYHDSNTIVEYGPKSNVPKTYWWYPVPGNKKIFEHSKKILNKGILAEGFLSAVLENRALKESSIEGNLKVLQDYVFKDSVPGIIKGDLIFNLDGKTIQLAIKQESFSTARVGQYINLAYNLRKIGNNNIQLSREQLQLYLPKLIQQEKVTERIIAAIQNQTEINVDKIIKDLGGEKAATTAGTGFYATLEVISITRNARD